MTAAEVQELSTWVRVVLVVLFIRPKIETLGDRFESIGGASIKDHLVLGCGGVEELEHTVSHLVDEVFGFLAGVRIGVDVGLKISGDRVDLGLAVQSGPSMIEIMMTWIDENVRLNILQVEINWAGQCTYHVFD